MIDGGSPTIPDLFRAVKNKRSLGDEAAISLDVPYATSALLLFSSFALCNLISSIVGLYGKNREVWVRVSRPSEI